MDELKILILFALGLWTASNIILGLITKRERMRLWRINRTEHTRAHFALAREELMRLAREEKLPVRSATFNLLYNLTTFVMRRPDEYKVIGNLVCQVIHIRRQETERIEDPLRGEAALLTPEVKRVFLQLAEGFDRLAVDFLMTHSWKLRLLDSIAHLTLSKKHVADVYGNALHSQVEKKPEAQNLKYAVKSMESYAGTRFDPRFAA